MSSQIIKSTKIVGIFCILLSCSVQNIKSISEILIAIPVAKDFYYSDESEYLVNGQIYSLRYRAKYKKGQLIGLKRYLPDGIIEYTLEELKNDTAILTSIELPILQHWEICPDLNLKTETNSVKLTKLDDFHFKESNGRRIFIVK
jgi:hypothetical protein